MIILYENSRYRVVNDGCPGLKIYDIALNQVDLHRFGGFYDDMGSSYPPVALDAAKQVADRAERFDAKLAS